MFPLTHAYAIGRLVVEAGPLHLLGAIFPDAVLVNGLRWEQTHQAGAALHAYLAEHYPAGRPFAVGVISHGVSPQGLDYYGDQRYGPFERGYCFEEARPYAARVAAICRLPASMGLWKGHNFVEMALEWLLAQRDPALGRRVRQVLQEPAGLEELSPHLEAFFGPAGSPLGESLPAMLPFLALEPLTPQALAERYQRQVRLKHGVETIDVPAAAAMIEEIAAAIQPRCWAFLEDVLGRIAAMLQQEEWAAGPQDPTHTP